MDEVVKKKDVVLTTNHGCFDGEKVAEHGEDRERKGVQAVG